MSSYLSSSSSSAAATVGETVVAATGTDDTLALEAALDSMLVDGKLNGTLRIKGRAALNSPLVIDGGYEDVTPGDANWETASPERFKMIGEISPEAGCGITIKGCYGAELDLGVHGGGARGDVADGAITSGQATLTSPLAVAAGVDVGWVVVVTGAGPDPGARQPLCATVRSIAGNVLTLSDTAEATVSDARVRFADVAVHAEDCLALKVDLYGKNHDGYLFHADAAGDDTLRVRYQRPGTIEGIGGAGTVFMKSIEAFGSLGDIWSSPFFFDYFGECDDLGWHKYEGGVGGDPDYGNDVYLWLDRLNNANISHITVGDRATECNVKINGPQSSFGHIGELRSSGYLAASSPAAVKVIGIDNGFIGYLLEKTVGKGLHVIGGDGTTPSSGLVIGHHLSLTGTEQPVYCEPDSSGNLIHLTEMRLHVRTCVKEAVKVATGVTTTTRVNIAGLIDQPNSGNTAIYAVDVLSDSVLLNVAGLTQNYRSGSLSGGIHHSAVGNVRGVKQARIGNPSTYGMVPKGWQGASVNAPPAIADGFLTDHAAIATATDIRNDSPFTLNIRALIRFQPTSGATVASIEVLEGPTSGSLGNNAMLASYAKYDGSTNGINDEMREIDLVVPPWWYFRFNLTASTINKVVWWVE